MTCEFDVYLWRQCLILFSDYIHGFGVGFMLSMPSVLNPAILSPHSDLKATPDEASWIAASHGISGVVGYIVMPVLMQAFGRKTIHFVINSILVIGFIMFFFAKNIVHLFIARLIHGLALSGIFVTAVIVAEYSSPKRRGFFTSFKKSAIILGSMICHLLIPYLTWRQISLIGIISNILAIITTIPWPESPAFLAMKGNFQECDKSHTWLFGNSFQSRKNLECLISAQMETQKEEYQSCLIKRIWEKITRKDFRKPVIITTLLTLVIEFSGRHYNLAYIVQIMTDIVGDKSVAVYCSLGNDLIIFTAIICSCFLIIKYKRRAILFSSGFVSVVIMLLISLTIFLKNHKYIEGLFIWLPPCLILINSFVTNLGLITIAFLVSGEIFPLEHRGIGICIAGVIFTSIYAIVLKITPYMIASIGVEGTYATYGLLLLICLIILTLVLNETKDKTLQEIEDEIKGIKRNEGLFLLKENENTRNVKPIEEE